MKNTAKYPITRVQIKNYTLVSGINYKTIDNIFMRTLPLYIVFAMVDHRSYNGSFDSSPFDLLTA